MKLRNLFISVLLLLATIAAQAETRVYLIVTRPGDDITSAFGHLLLEVERLPDDGSPGLPGRYNRVYQYSAPAFDRMLATGNIAHLINALLNEEVSTSRLMQSRGIWSRETQRDSIQSVRFRLNLTPEQSQTLGDNLATEWSQFSRTPYPYRNFSDNCTTRVRDHIFAVLPAENRAALETQPLASDLTYQALVTQSLNASIAIRGGQALNVVPASLRDPRNQYSQFINAQFPMLGISTTVASGDEFFAMVRNMRSQLGDPTSLFSTFVRNGANIAAQAGQPSVTREQMLAQFDAYLQMLVQPGLTQYQKLFTPVFLLEKLREMNLLTREEFVDSAARD